MMTIQQLTEYATDKGYFDKLVRYEDFARAFFDFAEKGLQARIVCQNEPAYQFFQYREDCGYNISRPVNTHLFPVIDEAETRLTDFNQAMRLLKKGETPPDSLRDSFTASVYTLQQSIGLVLDALPAEKSNQAKKINGDLFEHLIRLMMREMGVDCQSGRIQVPIKDDAGNKLFDMDYQHDLIIRKGGDIQLLGSVKTSSKDRIDKVFIDKLLFNRLAGTHTPYIAVFLNDVQRAQTKALGRYNVNSTFLSGHFKAYTVRLTPLDGVFYCDTRPVMKSDSFLAARIQTIDVLFFNELGAFRG